MQSSRVSPSVKWVVVSDFDGTFTLEDIGNALCERFIPEKFQDLHGKYKSGVFSLREYQKLIWTGFPLSENKMFEVAQSVSGLRPGLEKFLEICLSQTIPVYIASCGIKTYIEGALAKHIQPVSRKAILGVESHKGLFSASEMTEIEFRDPESKVGPRIPFNKGLFCDDIRKVWSEKFPDFRVKLVGIGNGTSDREFLGKVDVLFATEALATFCQKQNYPFTYFEDFNQIAHSAPFVET
jgi:2-hydroxy-3-keto-5-methylthiopentenyl-1-phosphate phosphatase